MENKLNAYLKPDLNKSYYYTIFSIKYILILLLLLLPFFIYSCKDDPVTINQSSTPLVDTADFYNWYMDTIWFYNLYGIYVADTNSVFLEGATYMIYYDGLNNNVIVLLVMARILFFWEEVLLAAPTYHSY
jgi:hypothetical protein